MPSAGLRLMSASRFQALGAKPVSHTTLQMRLATETHWPRRARRLCATDVLVGSYIQVLQMAALPDLARSSRSDIRHQLPLCSSDFLLFIYPYRTPTVLYESSCLQKYSQRIAMMSQQIPGTNSRRDSDSPPPPAFGADHNDGDQDFG